MIGFSADEIKKHFEADIEELKEKIKENAKRQAKELHEKEGFVYLLTMTLKAIDESSKQILFKTAELIEKNNKKILEDLQKKGVL